MAWQRRCDGTCCSQTGGISGGKGGRAWPPIPRRAVAVRRRPHRQHKIGRHCRWKRTPHAACGRNRTRKGLRGLVCHGFGWFGLPPKIEKNLRWANTARRQAFTRKSHEPFRIFHRFRCRRWCRSRAGARFQKPSIALPGQSSSSATASKRRWRIRLRNISCTFKWGIRRGGGVGPASRHRR